MTYAYTGSGWTVGAFGCAESHFRLLLHLAQRGDARGLVLEHDSLLAPGVSVEQACSVLQVHWTCVYMHIENILGAAY